MMKETRYIQGYFSRDERMIHALLLRAGFINTIGLMHGKMGIAVLFFCLYRKNKQIDHEDFAGELVEDIYKELERYGSLDFESGLVGIGCGMEFLVRNEFLETDVDIAEDLDEVVYTGWLEGRFQNTNILNGSGGLLLYFLYRAKSRFMQENKKEWIRKCICDVGLKWIKCIDFQWSKDVFDMMDDRIGNAFLIILLYRRGVVSKQAEEWLQHWLKNVLPEMACRCLQEFVVCCFMCNSRMLVKEFGMRANLLECQISRKKIREELNNKPMIWRYGCSGIAFMYLLLWRWSGELKFRMEYEYWLTYIYLSDDGGSCYAGYTPILPEKEWGVAEGIAGILFLECDNNDVK